ncbi:transposable element Tcb2 transposase [Trichonephila clavipes]|nr:transposable element Tcb2 transposase [Trichonephila clavipes]
MSFTRRPGSGRPRQTSRREVRHIVRNARVQPTASFAAIQAQVAHSLGTFVSSRTIQRRLAERHLGSRCPLRVLPLTPTHRRPPIDASVWSGAAHEETGLQWNGTRSSLVTSLDSISTVMTQQYVRDILQPPVLPLIQRLPGAIFQQDNARPHTARISQDCLRTVTTLPWPARSPDGSPIKHIWDHLGWRVGHPTSLNELEAGLQQIWNEMSEDIIQNLYASMPDCIASCIRARGSSTGY